MTHRPSTVERAFQLAVSGDCETLPDIRTRLVAEGYHDARQQLSGPAISRQLRQACLDARAAQAPAPEDVDPAPAAG